MYIFRTLIFVGIISLSICRPEIESPMQPHEQEQTKPKVQSKCTYLQPKQQFNATAYFHGRWYLTHLQIALVSPTDVCHESLSNILGDGTINHKIYSYSDKRIPQLIELDCTSNLGDIKDDLGKVPFHCKVTKNDKDLGFNMEGTIVETDYDHFALFYVCGKEQNEETGNLLLLNREKDGEPTDSRIADTLKKLGLDLSTFISRKNVNCKKHPSV